MHLEFLLDVFHICVHDQFNPGGPDQQNFAVLLLIWNCFESCGKDFKLIF
jgi:hypothetical protein